MKKNFQTKVLSWLLTCAVVFSMVSTSAFAAEDEANTAVNTEVVAEQNDETTPQTNDGEKAADTLETTGNDVEAAAQTGKEEAQVITVTDFNITSEEHNDADAELNQKINVTIDFSEPIKIDADKLKDALSIKIADGNVYDTKRDIKFSVNPENPHQLMIQMTSTDWVAIYNGMLTIEGYNMKDAITDAAGTGKEGVVKHLEGRIPIGIVVNNDVLATGTSDRAASTYVNVAHKANMRGMYFFELVKVVDGKEEVIGGPVVSHAHNFYSSINEAAIAKAMASKINEMDGYSTTYTDGETDFTVTADNAVAGEQIAVRMNELNAKANYAHTPVVDKAVAPTKDATGLTEGSHCSVCGTVLTAQEVIPKLDGSDNNNNGENNGSNNGSNNDSNNGSNNGSGNGSNGNNTGKTNTTTNSVKTGDTNTVYPYLILALVSCMAIIVMIRKRKSHK